MSKKLLGVLLTLGLISSACTPEEEGAPTFQVTSPTLATTSTLPPSTLEYIGLPELSDEENAMCGFISEIGRDLAASDAQSRAATAAAERASRDRTLSEPLKVRKIRDAEVANAQRFANVLKRFAEAQDLIAAIEPGEFTDFETLAQDAADAALLTDIGTGIQATVDTARPLNAAQQAAYLEQNGEEWKDLFTEEELDLVTRSLNNDSTGMGREQDARDAMERLDDWSWRHCAAGLTD